MGQEFKEELVIPYFGTDHFLRLTPSSLAVCFQDLAIDHSDSIGFTLDWLWKEKKGWAITNWHIQVLRMPTRGEKVVIKTWSDNCRRMQARRSFTVTDESGHIVVKAVSRWIYMDLEKRKPSAIPKEMEEGFVCDTPAVIENEKYIMPKGQEENFSGERSFSVTRRDTDTNGHANNTKYIEWAIDDVPDDIYAHYRISDIRVVYRKECYKDDEVLSKCYISGQDEKEVISYFVDPKKPETVFCEVSTVWVKDDDTEKQSEIGTVRKTAT